MLAIQLRIGKVQMAGIAKSLDISEATLRRRLAVEGTSFSALVDGVRFELAKRYLQDPTLELGDVSLLLGFRDPDTFRAAFVAWSDGAPPESYRAA